MKSKLDALTSRGSFTGFLDRVPGTSVHGVRHRRSIGLRATLEVVDHSGYMRLALAEAARARDLGEVPVGAVVMLNGQVVGSGCNQPISKIDPTAHAEINALRAAAATIGNYRLSGATLYVTIEPCLMCVGAMIHARVELVVFGAAEPRAGALVSSARAHETPGLNHRLSVHGGVLEDECRGLIQTFFRERREGSSVE